MPFKINDFDKLMYSELEHWTNRKTHGGKGRRVSIRALAEKHNLDTSKILESFKKLELIGLCEIRTKNAVVLKNEAEI